MTELVTAGTGTRYLATLDGKPLGEVALPVPGRHLALNSAAAVLTGGEAGRRRCDSIVEALAAFPGVRRRFELKGTAAGVRVYDEYAYHPTSMTAALDTLREVAGDGRLIVVFQPYRMYRTRDMQAEIAAALAHRRRGGDPGGVRPGRGARAGRGRRRADRRGRPAGRHKVFVPSWDDVPAEVVRAGPRRATWW